MYVQRYRSIDAITLAASKPGRMTRAPPAIRIGLTADAIAFLWYRGTATRARSVSSNIMTRRTASAFQNCPPCVSNTPFGFPVDPDVYGCMQTSWGATWTVGNSGEAASSRRS